jgi:hypothetical protein
MNLMRAPTWRKSSVARVFEEPCLSLLSRNGNTAFNTTSQTIVIHTRAQLVALKHFGALIADHEANYPPKRPVGNEFAHRFEAWMGRSDREKDEAYTRPFSNAAITSCLNRSFVTTLNGHLALVPRLTVPGHLVCVLRGGNVPFILQSKKDEYFELLGEAYVHGIMNGEFVRGAQNDDVKVFTIR